MSWTMHNTGASESSTSVFFRGVGPRKTSDEATRARFMAVSYNQLAAPREVSQKATSEHGSMQNSPSQERKRMGSSKAPNEHRSHRLLPVNRDKTIDRQHPIPAINSAWPSGDNWFSTRETEPDSWSEYREPCDWLFTRPTNGLTTMLSHPPTYYGGHDVETEHGRWKWQITTIESMMSVIQPVSRKDGVDEALFIVFCQQNISFISDDVTYPMDGLTPGIVKKRTNGLSQLKKNWNLIFKTEPGRSSIGAHPRKTLHPPLGVRH
ncbi:hypothetical protein N7519_008652 [Penicillium mononematosum]|uniref:uncharacterized protein n=1 Tax=Penicillium mononematosum TaxID=268346 RepID=UPI00254807BD|nr:uncharacterized protein N7519_008652 [Penicillium mononematosum]KAJ6178191.1 hypothetical protein N7519_008652 [Penicillium mononematosum]